METFVDLYRHAPTRDNDDHVICGGDRDTPLSQRGIKACMALKGLLARVGEDSVYQAVYCAPLQRARQTISWTGVGGRLVMAPEIIECRWGDYEGLPFADPRIVEAFVKVRTDRNYAPQGGESHGRVMQRIGNYAFPIIASAKGGKLAFCSSIGAFRSLFIRYFNLEYTSGFSIGVPNCCVYRLLPNRPRNPELALEYLTAKNGRWMPGFCPADEHSPISNGR